MLSELGTEAWFRTRERALPPATTWSLTLPTASPEFRHSTLPRRTLQSLRCDTAHRCSWTDSSGYDWLLLYVRWLPGNNAAQFSQLHSPDACLPAAGWMLHPLPGLRPLGPLQPPLPFLSYRIQDLNGRSGYLFFCRTTDRRDDESQAPGLTRSQRVHRMFQGRTNQGATVLELAVFGPPDDAAAQRCVAATLANALIPH